MMKKKKAFTLLEIMIAISLVVLIGGVMAYNMKGSLEEGKAFKTKQAAARIRDILELQIAQGGHTPQEVIDNAEGFLEASGMVKKGKDLLTDGWNGTFDIRLKKNGDIVVSSQALISYEQRKKHKIEKKNKSLQPKPQPADEEEEEELFSS